MILAFNLSKKSLRFQVVKTKVMGKGDFFVSGGCKPHLTSKSPLPTAITE